MRKYTSFFIFGLILLFTSGPKGFAESSLLVTAVQAQGLPYNSTVLLRGNIIFGLGGGRYLFRDSSGDMVVKVETDKWGGLSIGPSDRIEVNGELKRDERNWQFELDVRNIRKASGTAGRGAAELEYLFIWPVVGRITSPFGYRNSPFTGRREFHSGIDIRAAMGTPVRAAMSGRVSSVGRDRVFGNFITIDHHSGLRTIYAHLSHTRVRSGAYVETGERIGDSGNSGQSTGPHLHFGVFRNGVRQNPRTMLR